MKLRSIKLKILLRILLLAVSFFLVSYLIFETESFVQAIYASFLPIIFSIELYLYIDRNNKRIKNYLNAIELDDLSIKMPENIPDKSFLDLNKSLNKFSNKLETLRKDSIAQFYFIDALVKKAQVGLLVIDQNDTIYFVNESFAKLIGKPRIQLHQSASEEIPMIWKSIQNLNLNDKKSIDIKIHELSSVLLFQVSEFIIDNQKYRLYSAQNIKSELENTEIEAWKKLIRILSHEILNSASPILSLSNSLSDLIQDHEINQDKLIAKITEGLDVINQRSSGLIKFTNAFSTISKLPNPEKIEVQTKELFQKLKLLFQNELSNKEIDFEFKVYPKAEKLFIDHYQIEQVFINLIKNSIESFKNKDDQRIIIKAFNQNKFIRIEIIDNGSGISEDKLDKVFLPFFTTKEKGNGIGLALSKQILNLHKGNINIDSKIEQGTKIILEVPITN